MEKQIEECCNCGVPTGKAGQDEDSYYHGEIGPLCEGCNDLWLDGFNWPQPKRDAKACEPWPT